MKSQVVFKIDKKLKDKAMEKAGKAGVTLSDVLQLATRAFAAGELEVSLIRKREELKDSVKKDLERAMRDIKAGRNMSPAFDNVEDMIKYLEGTYGNKT